MTNNPVRKPISLLWVYHTAMEIELPQISTDINWQAQKCFPDDLHVCVWSKWLKRCVSGCVQELYCVANFKRSFLNVMPSLVFVHNSGTKTL